MIETKAGRLFRRNRQHLLRTEEEFIPDTHSFHELEETLEREESLEREEPETIALQTGETGEPETVELEEQTRADPLEPYDEEPLPRETPEPSDEEDHRTSESENLPDDADDSSDELERIPNAGSRPDIYTTYLSDQYIPSSPHPSTECGESSSSEQEEGHLATPEHQPHTATDFRRGNPHRNPSSISRLGVAEDYIKGEEDWTASEEEEASIYNIIIDSLNVKPR